MPAANQRPGSAAGRGWLAHAHRRRRLPPAMDDLEDLAGPAPSPHAAPAAAAIGVVPFRRRGLGGGGDGVGGVDAGCSDPSGRGGEATAAPGPLADPLGLGPTPGTARVWVKAFGCGHSASEGETMAGVLAAAGYRRGGVVCGRGWAHEYWESRAIHDGTAFDSIENSCPLPRPSGEGRGMDGGRGRAGTGGGRSRGGTTHHPAHRFPPFPPPTTPSQTLSPAPLSLVPDADADTAHAWVINSCTVKTPSQAAVGRLASKARAAGAALVVAGCVPAADRDAPELVGASLVAPAHIGRVADVVGEALRGNTVHLLKRGPLPSLDLPKARGEECVMGGGRGWAVAGERRGFPSCPRAHCGRPRPDALHPAPPPAPA